MSGSDNASARGELDARLDEAFRRLPDTDDLRDLKDELRASLAARAAELQASGSGPTAAVSTAFAELGDIEQLAAEVTGEWDADQATLTGVPKAAGTDARGRAVFELAQRHRVRPRPAFVVRTVLLSVVAAAGLALTVLATLGILGWPIGASLAVAVVLAAPIGVIVGDGTHQETTTNYPVPGGRAVGYGASAFLGLAGLALG
ncbi:permease prefix domain 1-containing protein, partial [Humibacter sp.]|uniref:permease prefix domain 1-containing protein n=1 Tax=Humibacter sp. TaxID=1940291 RepID=UPI003F7D4ED5